MSDPIETLLAQVRDQSGAVSAAWTGPAGRVELPRCGGAPWDAGLGSGLEGVLRLGPGAAARVPRLAAMGARFAAVRHGDGEAGPRRLALAARGGLRLSDDGLEAVFTALFALEEERARAERVRRRAALAELGRAAAGAAHDLRNALSTALLELDGLDGGAPESAEGLRRAVEGARELARDFLEERTAPERRPVELGALVRRELARLPQGAVRFALAGELFVAGRRDLLARVVGNLLANALAASPRGATVEVGARPTEAGVELTIEDRGRGMDQAHLDGYLEPGATRAGSGFGTASVLNCLARVGGELWIESTPGVGTRCVVRLLRSPRPGGKSALVHDPDPVARWSWREVFERAGYEPLDTDRLDVALAWMEGARPAVALTPRAAAGALALARVADEQRVVLARCGVAAADGEVFLPRVADRSSVELLERLVGG